MRKRIAAMIAAIIMVALTVVLCSCESKSAKLIPVNEYDNPKMDQVVAAEIKKAYFKKLSDENLTEKGSVYSPQSPSDLFIMCYYGNFSGCEAVMIGGDGIDYTEAYRPVYVAEYEIVFPSGQPLYMYKEGKFYLVKEAYDAGVITKNDVCELAEIFALLTEND